MWNDDAYTHSPSIGSTSTSLKVCEEKAVRIFITTTAPVDVYDAELERMNTSLAAENQGLLHDNKQLGALIKEYEQTLESVMGAFRTRAVRQLLYCRLVNVSIASCSGTSRSTSLH